MKRGGFIFIYKDKAVLLYKCSYLALLGLIRLNFCPLSLSILVVFIVSKDYTSKVVKTIPQDLNSQKAPRVKRKMAKKQNSEKRVSLAERVIIIEGDKIIDEQDVRLFQRKITDLVRYSRISGVQIRGAIVLDKISHVNKKDFKELMDVCKKTASQVVIIEEASR